jgi:hypothetical protein
MWSGSTGLHCLARSARMWGPWGTIPLAGCTYTYLNRTLYPSLSLSTSFVVGVTKTAQQKYTARYEPGDRAEKINK